MSPRVTRLLLGLSGAGPRAGCRVRDHQPGADRRRGPGGRGLGHHPVGAGDPQRRQHHQQRHRVLPLRSRRGHRLPDEPVQHRGRRAVPRRRLHGGRGRAARPGCPATSTPPWPSSPRWPWAPSWAGIAGLLRADPRRQRGHLHDHAQLHRDLAWSPTCCARSPSARRAATPSTPSRSPKAAGSRTSRSARAPAPRSTDSS